jgi:hypothetical protein
VLVTVVVGIFPSLVSDPAGDATPALVTETPAAPTDPGLTTP